MAEDRPGAHPRPQAPVEDLYPPPMAADVHQDSVALGLAAETGAAGPQGDRDA